MRPVPTFTALVHEAAQAAITCTGQAHGLELAHQTEQLLQDVSEGVLSDELDFATEVLSDLRITLLEARRDCRHYAFIVERLTLALAALDDILLEVVSLAIED